LVFSNLNWYRMTYSIKTKLRCWTLFENILVVWVAKFTERHVAKFIERQVAKFIERQGSIYWKIPPPPPGGGGGKKIALWGTKKL
jgi:hypothetical protein